VIIKFYVRESIYEKINAMENRSIKSTNNNQ